MSTPNTILSRFGFVDFTGQDVQAANVEYTSPEFQFQRLNGGKGLLYISFDTRPSSAPGDVILEGRMFDDTPYATLFTEPLTDIISTAGLRGIVIYDLPILPRMRIRITGNTALSGANFINVKLSQ